MQYEIRIAELKRRNALEEAWWILEKMRHAAIHKGKDALAETLMNARQHIGLQYFGIEQ